MRYMNYKWGPSKDGTIRYDDMTDDRNIYYKVKNFRDMDHANEYKAMVESNWGYFPRAIIKEVDGEIILYCSKSLSCD